MEVEKELEEEEGRKWAIDRPAPTYIKSARKSITPREERKVCIAVEPYFPEWIRGYDRLRGRLKAPVFAHPLLEFWGSLAFRLSLSKSQYIVINLKARMFPYCCVN